MRIKVMHQTWRHLLFAHWPVSPELVQQSLPPGLTVDTHDGQAWISVVPFHLSYMPVGLHLLPLHRQFVELNLRTYVTLNGVPGVYFYTLEATDRLSVMAAQRLFHLSYRHARMHLWHNDNTWHFLGTRSSQPGPVHVEVNYTPARQPLEPKTPLDRFLTDRNCLFTTHPNGRWMTTHIWHADWPLQPVETVFVANTLPQAFGFQLDNPLKPALAHYCHSLPVQTGWTEACPLPDEQRPQAISSVP
jgi:uncharacterized protein